MSKFHRLTAFSVAMALAVPAFAEGYDLGRPATDDEVAAWDIDVRPDGMGLPEGSGSVAEGEPLYTDYCSACHGVFGEAVGRWPVLAGGEGTLAGDDPNKTIGSYWPYLSTVFDYVHRAMPFGAAQSLTDDEVYAITAYLLYLNYVVEDEDFVLSRDSFAEVADLPNEDNFYMDDRDVMEIPGFTRNVCMTDCKSSVEITARARVIDVTPDTGEATETTEATATTETPEPAATPEPEVTEAAAPAGPDPELVAAGEKVFRQCQSCHQIGDGAKNRAGPILTDVVGRTFGAVDDYSRYSGAMKDAHDEGKVWSEDALAAFLANPRDYLSGTSMSFRGLKDDEDVAAVIAYLSANGG